MIHPAAHADPPVAQVPAERGAALRFVRRGIEREVVSEVVRSGFEMQEGGESVDELDG